MEGRRDGRTGDRGTEDGGTGWRDRMEGRRDGDRDVRREEGRRLENIQVEQSKVLYFSSYPGLQEQTAVSLSHVP
jgi:hypothetical protein